MGVVLKKPKSKKPRPTPWHPAGVVSMCPLTSGMASPSYPRHSMCAIYAYIGVVFGVNVGIYGSPMECLGIAPDSKRVTEMGNMETTQVVIEVAQTVNECWVC